MSGRKTSLMNRKGLVLGLLGLTMVYQATYQVLMSRVLQEEAAAWEDAAACRGGGSSHGSPGKEECRELELFRAWQTAPTTGGLEEGVSAGEAGRTTSSPQGDHWLLSGQPPPAAASLGAHKAIKTAELHRDFEARRRTLLEDHVGREEEMLAQLMRQAGDASSRDPHVSLWAREVGSLRKDLEAGDLVTVANALSASSRSTISPAGPEDHLTHSQLHEARATQRAQIQRELEEHKAALEGSLAAVSADHVAWSQRFQEEARQARRELCEDPERRARADCLEFTSAAEADRTHVALASHSMRLAGGGGGLRGGHVQLRWTDVTSAWSAVGWFPNQGAAVDGEETQFLVLKPQELESARWASRVPRVACITTIPSGADQGQMWDLVNRFFKQSYEGEAQLVLVYHHKDKATAGLARLFADGSQIRSVAAQEEEGITEEFPSSTALRFGAWSAANEGAEVIAHWDFSTKYHPTRLSLQVRALAFSARPASIIAWPSDVEGKTAEEEGSIQASALLGVSKWMRRHWQPSAKEILKGLPVQELVRVRAETTWEQGP